MLHIKSIKPMFTSLVTTAERFNEDMYEGAVLIAKKGDLKLWQKVIAKGPSVRDIEVGDMVMINVGNYARKKYDKNSLQNDIDNNPTISYEFNWVTLDDEKGNPKDCLLLNDRDILYSFIGEEKQEDFKPLIMPKKKTIIVN